MPPGGGTMDMDGTTRTNAADDCLFGRSLSAGLEVRPADFLDGWWLNEATRVDYSEFIYSFRHTALGSLRIGVIPSSLFARGWWVIVGRTRLRREDVAAWVLKGSPDIYDVEGALVADDPFESWRLSPSYRLDLIAVGDPCLLWVSGKDRGFRASGEVTGLPSVDQGGTRHWVKLREKKKVRPYLPVDLRPIPKILEPELLADPRFEGAEVIRIRQMSNPSYLTRSQFEAVRSRMDLTDR
jgi:hypothetical protein